MRNTTIQHKNFPMRLAGILLCLAVLSVYLVIGLYARFMSSDKERNSARAAVFAFRTNDGESSRYLDLSEIKKPGDSKSYTFTVSNQYGSVISEVAESYSISVMLNGSMPLSCTVTTETNEAVLTASVDEGTAVPVVKEKTNAGSFHASAAAEDKYILTLTWPADKNDEKYASGCAVAEAVLTVTGKQTD